jgi:hypothetical protein
MGQSTQVTSKQREMPLLGNVKRDLATVQDSVLNGCDSLLDAIHVCVHLGRLPHYAIAQRLGIDKGHWARMMQGQAHFPTNKIQALMETCGNLAPFQFLARQMGIRIAEDEEAAEERRLRNRLAELEAKRQSTGLNEGQRLAA